MTFFIWANSGFTTNAGGSSFVGCQIGYGINGAAQAPVGQASSVSVIASGAGAASIVFSGTQTNTQVPGSINAGDLWQFSVFAYAGTPANVVTNTSGINLNGVLIWSPS